MTTEPDLVKDLYDGWSAAFEVSPTMPLEKVASNGSGVALPGEITPITSFRDPDLFASFGLPRAMDPGGSPDLFTQRPTKTGP